MEQGWEKKKQHLLNVYTSQHMASLAKVSNMNAYSEYKWILELPVCWDFKITAPMTLDSSFLNICFYSPVHNNEFTHYPSQVCPKLFHICKKTPQKTKKTPKNLIKKN